MTEWITLRPETTEMLIMLNGRKEVDLAQRAISSYLDRNEVTFKRIMLIVVRHPLFMWEDRNMLLRREVREAKEEAKILFDELVYQYKLLHPQFRYGELYLARTNAEEEMLEALNQNPYAYDIVMERLEKCKDDPQSEREEIIEDLNSGWNSKRKKGLKQLGIDKWAVGHIAEASQAIAAVFEEMTT